MKRNFAILTMALVCALGFVACSDDDDEPLRNKDGLLLIRSVEISFLENQDRESDGIYLTYKDGRVSSCELSGKGEYDGTVYEYKENIGIAYPDVNKVVMASTYAEPGEADIQQNTYTYILDSKGYVTSVAVNEAFESNREYTFVYNGNGMLESITSNSGYEIFSAEYVSGSKNPVAVTTYGKRDVLTFGADYENNTGNNLACVLLFEEVDSEEFMQYAALFGLLPNFPNMPTAIGSTKVALTKGGDKIVSGSLTYKDGNQDITSVYKINY